MAKTEESEIKYCKSEIFIDKKVIDIDAEVTFEMGKKTLRGQKALSEEHILNLYLISSRVGSVDSKIARLTSGLF